MDIKEFSKQIKAKRKELDELMKRKMPVLAGRMAKDHYRDNFRQGGFVNNGLRPRKKAKDFLQEEKDAASQYGTLLSSRNHMFSSIKYVPGDYRVKVSDELIYAPVHNWGGTVHPTVTAQMRRFAGRSTMRQQVRRKRPVRARKRANRKILRVKSRRTQRHHAGKGLH